MIVTLFCFLFTTLIFLVVGKSFLFINNSGESRNYSIFDSYFIGLCLSGAFLNIWSLVLPTDFISFLFLAATTLFFIWYHRKYYKVFCNNLFSNLRKDKVLLVFLFLCLAATLFYAVITPKLFDTYLYHINTIQWNEKFRVVPGLANLHDRFGFNSSMLVLSACFSYADIYNQYIFVLSSLSFFFFLAWCIKTAYQKKGIIAFFILVFAVYFSLQYGLDISSPGTDLLPNILVSYLLLNLISDQESIEKKFLVFVILSLFCVTLKLSMAPFVLLGLFALFNKSKKIGFITFKLFTFGSFLVLPWIIRNIILSGYLLFPMESLDFFSFDWKVPPARVADTKIWIYSWGRIPFKDAYQVMSMPLSTWFEVWWDAAFLKNKIFFCSAVLAPLSLIVLKFTYKDLFKNSLILSFIAAYIGFAAWFLTAPDVRFCFAPILYLSLLPILFLQKPIAAIINNFSKYLILAAVGISLFTIGNEGFKLFNKDYSLSNISQYSYLPDDFSTSPEKRNAKFSPVSLITKQGKSIDFYETIPHFSKCFDFFPASVFLQTDLSLRGEDLQDGFIITSTKK